MLAREMPLRVVRPSPEQDPVSVEPQQEKHVDTGFCLSLSKQL